MTDFGHFGTSRGGVCVDIWGAGPFVITAGGKQFRFEDSDRFGPVLVGKSGDLLANPYPPERSPFWAAHRAWVAQGRPLDVDACVFDPPNPTLYRKDAKSRAIVVEAGDEGGGYSVLWAGQRHVRIRTARASLPAIRLERRRMDE